MKKSLNVKQRGQAMLELLMILFAATILMILLIITTAWGEADNARLLHVKRSAELGSVNENAEPVSRNEVTTWQRKSVDLYNNGEKIAIPFTPADYSYNGNNSIGNADQELTNTYNSASEDYTYKYYTMQEFGQNQNNPLEQTYNTNSTQAAGLIMRGDANDTSNNSYDKDIWKNSQITREITDLFYRLCGYKIPSPEKNETNKVFFPVHQ